MNSNIKVQIKNKIYQNNTYIIGLAKVIDTNDDNLKDYINKTITITGYFDEYKLNEILILYGEILNHKKYGIQYNTTYYEKVKPNDKDGMIEFLSSDMFPKVGVKMATNIINLLGTDSFNKIVEDHTCILEIPKMTNKIALMIKENLVKYEESEKTIVYLCNLGFSLKVSLDIYNKYKSETVSNMENNIYTLLYDDLGITFNEIDCVREKLAIELDDERRIEACIIYSMKDLSFKNGDTYNYKEEIIDCCNKYLCYEVDNDKYEYLLMKLNKDKFIIVEENRYYLKSYYTAESYIANKVMHLVDNSVKVNKNKIKKIIDDIELKFEIKYSKKQKEAITNSIKNNFLIVTGGPGTGKTTIIKAIVEAYKIVNDLDDITLQESIALLAPTGRASKKMSESIFESATIHRFLKWNKENNSFLINEYNKSQVSFIIIDESSMIDTLLFDSLLKGLRDDVKVIMVGDYNQLPSVAPGEILKSLVESNSIPLVELDILYRQEKESYIPKLALDIKNDIVNIDDDKKDDFKFIETDPMYLSQAIVSVCTMALKKGYSKKDIQVLIPMYKGMNGIDNINKHLQEIFNPKEEYKNEIIVGDVLYRECDKIILLTNMIEDNIFNGDIGDIIEIRANKNEIVVDFEGNIKIFKKKDFIHIKHSYAMSIHKSQGSEFKIVVMPLDYSYKRMLYKKLIYTGITRAKNSLIMIGDIEILKYSINNNFDSNRKTSLLKFISNIYEYNNK